MFTRFLFKPSLTFTILALLLLPQIAITGTAFAASISDVPPSNFYCLDVNGSTTLTGSVVSVPSPPGTGVKFQILPRVTNNCTENNPVSNVTVTFTLKAVCPPPSLNKTKSTSFVVPNPLAQGQPAGASYMVTTYCIVYSGVMPIASEVPTSLSVDIDATGTNASGQKVYSPVKTETVLW